MRSNINKTKILLFLLLTAFLFSCSNNNRSVKDIIDDTVTQMYQTMDKKELNTLTNDKVINLFSKNDLEILATKYWMFDVNVPSVISIMRDKGQKITPYWLEGYSFNKTEMIVTNEHNTYEVWQK